MKLEEAIKENNEAIDYLERAGKAGYAKSVKLGNEALKRIVIERKHLFALRHPKLPGETKE